MEEYLGQGTWKGDHQGRNLALNDTQGKLTLNSPLKKKGHKLQAATKE